MNFTGVPDSGVARGRRAPADVETIWPAVDIATQIHGAAVSPTPRTWAVNSLSPLLDDEMAVDEMDDRLRRVCGRFALVPAEGQRLLLGGVRPVRAGGEDAVVVGQNVQRIARDEFNIRQDPGEFYFLVFQDHGHSLMCQQGVQFRMRPGDFMLIDSTKPSDFIYAGARSQQISLHLPRDEMHLRFGDTIHAGIGVLRQDALGLAMRAILAKMLEPKNQESLHLKEAFLAVFGSFLLEQGGAATRPTSKEDLLSVAMRHIAVRYQDPAFNAAALATALNMQPRSLQRLFQRVGATPSRSILDARLDAAQTLLRLRFASPHAQHISSVAYGCGFNDLSFFYREFRKKFGRKPGAAP